MEADQAQAVGLQVVLAHTDQEVQEVEAQAGGKQLFQMNPNDHHEKSLLTTFCFFINRFLLNVIMKLNYFPKLSCTQHRTNKTSYC